jgi:hypothetical protein
MAMVMLLVEGVGDEVAISAGMADDLARLGITNVSICRDRETVGIVLEGWAFDATTADAAARSLIQAPHVGRVLLPSIRLALSDVHGTPSGVDGATRAASLSGTPRPTGTPGPRDRTRSVRP